MAARYHNRSTSGGTSSWSVEHMGKGADLTPPKISSLASPHGPKASDGSLKLWEIVLLRGARPFKAKLHLICFNNRCFDFKPIIYILMLVVDLGTSECDKHRITDSTPSSSTACRTSYRKRSRQCHHWCAHEVLTKLQGQRKRPREMATMTRSLIFQQKN